jgi:hypothetical protein
MSKQEGIHAPQSKIFRAHQHTGCTRIRKNVVINLIWLVQQHGTFRFFKLATHFILQAGFPTTAAFFLHPRLAHFLLTTINPCNIIIFYSLMITSLISPSCFIFHFSATGSVSKKLGKVWARKTKRAGTRLAGHLPVSSSSSSNRTTTSAYATPLLSGVLGDFTTVAR